MVVGAMSNPRRLACQVLGLREDELNNQDVGELTCLYGSIYGILGS